MAKPSFRSNSANDIFFSSDNNFILCTKPIIINLSQLYKIK
nr:MAG TPA: hypothetical protein [Caudoviricetes sp.]DAQ42257.1 MAG TPA: hypothetical protein [Caudoviricetes sp.]